MSDEKHKQFHKSGHFGPGKLSKDDTVLRFRRFHWRNWIAVIAPILITVGGLITKTSFGPGIATMLTGVVFFWPLGSSNLVIDKRKGMFYKEMTFFFGLVPVRYRKETLDHFVVRNEQISVNQHGTSFKVDAVIFISDRDTAKRRKNAKFPPNRWLVLPEDLLSTLSKQPMLTTEELVQNIGEWMEVEVPQEATTTDAASAKKDDTAAADSKEEPLLSEEA